MTVNIAPGGDPILPYAFRMPVTVRLAPGGIGRLGEWLVDVPERPLLVMGAGSARANGALAALEAQFPHLRVLAGVPENPTTVWCDAGAAFCREEGCDAVIGVGGGSPLDAAKAIALLAVNEGAAREHFSGRAATRAPLPIIAIPTTAGTGSEVTQYAVLADPDEATATAGLPGRGQKRTLRGEGLFPRLALLDPTLTVGLPRHMTIATGLDALSQAMEGIVSRSATALGDVLALEVCRLVRRWLPVAVAAPEDLEARAAMLHAAMLSGCVIAQSGTTLVHGMGYYYTLHCGVQHGLANGLLLGPVFRYNARHVPEKVAALAQALGVPCAAE
jgi:alcohol dehydrogenase class IV